MLFLFWHYKSKSGCTLIFPFTPPHGVFLSRNPALVHSPTQLTSEEFVDLLNPAIPLPLPLYTLTNYNFYFEFLYPPNKYLKIYT